MKFVILKASDFDYERVYEISTIKELMAFIEVNGAIVVSGAERIYDGERMNTILIYDDYIE